MQYNYRNKYLVVIDDAINVHKYEKCKFVQQFLSFQANKIFIGKSNVCELTEISGVSDNNSDFYGNTLLLKCENNEYV